MVTPVVTGEKEPALSCPVAEVPDPLPAGPPVAELPGQTEPPTSLPPPAAAEDLKSDAVEDPAVLPSVTGPVKTGTGYKYDHPTFL